MTITNQGIEMRLTIPAIEAVVMFKGLLFSVDVPMTLFYGNTEGQCGKLIIEYDLKVMIMKGKLVYYDSKLMLEISLCSN